MGELVSSGVKRSVMETRAPYLASREEFTSIGREVMTSAPVFGAYISVLIFNYVFVVVEPYQGMFDPIRTLVFVTWAVAIWIVPYIWLGQVAYFATVRDLPYFWVVLGMMASVNVVLALIGHLFIIPGSQITHMLSQIGKITGFQAGAMAFLTIYLRNRYSKRLSSRPEIIPWFAPTGDASIPLLMELPQDIRGEVLRMESMNQYVKVTTDKGSELVRMSLAKACDQVPEAAGWRIHRSLWIAKSEARSVVFEAGNPRLVVRGGERLAMSRQAAPIVKDYLETAQAADV